MATSLLFVRAIGRRRTFVKDFEDELLWLADPKVLEDRPGCRQAFRPGRFRSPDGAAVDCALFREDHLAQCPSQS
jgi:hypothetical protein